MYTQITASLPYFDANVNLNAQHIDMLIKGYKYVVASQQKYSKKTTDDIVNQQFKTLSRVIKSCLDDHHISYYDGLSKYAFEEFRKLLHNVYSKSMPTSLRLRSRHEYKIMKSLVKFLRQHPDIVIRRTDKSKVFYIGKSSNLDVKTQEYMMKTNAYENVTVQGCPLVENMNAIRTLIDSLQKKGVLTVQQRNALLVEPEKLELGHFHAVPKPHKVSTL